MIFKLMALLAVIFLAYLVFFKKNREKDIKNKKDHDVIDNMDACPTCNTFIAKDDAILSNGKYYCSTECLGK